MSQSSDARLQRVTDLQTATTQYITAEKTRIDNEVSVLEKVLNGRTGGAGIQQPSKEHIAAVAQNDLSSYLAG